MNEKITKPCPFCGRVQSEDNPEYEFVREAGHTGYHFQVICKSCRARGPLADSLHEAIEAWNKWATHRISDLTTEQRHAIVVEAMRLWPKRCVPTQTLGEIVAACAALAEGKATP